MTTTPAAAPTQPPAFTSAATCREWLAQVPLTDAPRAQAMLLMQANLLNRASLPPGERVDILELLRGPIYETQEAYAGRFAGKPLPLTAAEQAAFDSCRALWHALATGYMRSAEACFSGDATVKPRAGLILQRALAALLAEQFENHRASRIPAGEHWRVMHQLFESAEHLNVADQTVMDPVRLGKTPSSAATTYAEALLLAAANLHEHSQRRINWIARWARRWAVRVRVLAAPPTLSTQAIPLCVDLASDQPAGYRPLDTVGARWLDTAELRRSLKKRIVMLEQGETPAKLNLGEDCTQPACEQMLRFVYQRWCKGAAVRGFERRPASGNCRVIAGTDAIHYYLSDRKPFQQEAKSDIDLLRREREEIAMFGRIATHRDEHFSEEHGYAIEQWQALEDWHMVDSSMTGMRIGRPVGQSGSRIVHGQLIAACPHGAQSFLLGSVRWALVDETLQVGLYLCAGQPTAVALRGTGPAAVNEKYRPAFLLPAVAAVRQEASLVAPIGTFKLGRIVEVRAGESKRLRLTRLLERGADFERTAYEAV